MPALTGWPEVPLRLASRVGKDGCKAMPLLKGEQIHRDSQPSGIPSRPGNTLNLQPKAFHWPLSASVSLSEP